MYSSFSNSIKVMAIPLYQGESVEEDKEYSVWSYNIIIENHSDTTIKILSRYWKIIDSSGLIHEITGNGVVGKNPVIFPGDLFEYTSFTNLHTSSGVMVGKYYAENVDTGQSMEIDIPAFSLDNPEEERVLN
ncbi:MAG: Co2+/Mg2+ efflux protein ApaG [Alphaproteobacteria bacterium]